MTFQDIVAYSRNVGAAKVALKLGKTTQAASDILFQTWQRLGIGEPTGIDLYGEVGGLVTDPAISKWRQIDLANGSFGQGVAVTPIQLATAYSAMVNGGTLVQPHVVASIGDQAQSPAPRGQALPAEAQPDAHLDAEPRRDDGRLLPGSHAGSRLLRGRQDRYGPDLEPEGERRQGRLEGRHLQLLVRRVHRQGDAAARGGRAGPRRARRRSSSRASWRCRSCRSSSFAASQPTPSRRSTCLRRCHRST